MLTAPTRRGLFDLNQPTPLRQETRNSMPIKLEEAVQLMRLEYAELPGLRLTVWQAQRLWNLSAQLCDEALAWLVHAGFLARMSDGSYVRAADAGSTRGFLVPQGRTEAC